MFPLSHIYHKPDRLLVKVVERRNLAAVNAELYYQMSGSVSDESAQSVGRKLGAQIILFGSLAPLGDVYRMRLRALAVETAEVLGVFARTVQPEAQMAAIVASDKPIKLPEMWKHRTINFGLRGGAGFNVYNVNTYTDYYSFRQQANPSASFSCAVSVTGNITSWLALQIEAIYTRDTTEIETEPGGTIEYGGMPAAGGQPANFQTENDKATVTYHSLWLPVLMKLSWKPGSWILSVLGGIYLNFPVSSLKFEGKANGADWKGVFEAQKATLNYGLMFGASAGYHLGAGVILFDFRYAADMKHTLFEPKEGSWNNYQWDWMPQLEFPRKKFMVTVGYEIGIL
jgi:hypothetical protein